MSIVKTHRRKTQKGKLTIVKRHARANKEKRNNYSSRVMAAMGSYPPNNPRVISAAGSSPPYDKKNKNVFDKYNYDNLSLIHLKEAMNKDRIDKLKEHADRLQRVEEALKYNFNRDDTRPSQAQRESNKRYIQMLIKDLELQKRELDKKR